MIVPRAETPTAIVGYKYGRVRLDFRTQKGRAGNFNHVDTSGGIERFSATMEGAHSPRHGYLTSVVIRGQAQKLEDGTMHIDLDVDADEPIRFAVEDLEVVKMTRDGQAIDRSDSPSGKFRVTVVASAKSTGN